MIANGHMDLWKRTVIFLKDPEKYMTASNVHSVMNLFADPWITTTTTIQKKN